MVENHRDRFNLRPTTLAGTILLLLAASAASVALAPLLMPGSYSVIEHAVSESAAQGVDGAWLARAGLMLLGSAVLVSANLASSRWGLGGRISHRVYGMGMIAAAAFAHSPWEDVPFDEFEDLLHSAAASLAGLAFAVGVVTVSVQRGPGTTAARVFDWFAVGAAIVIPMTMFNVEGIAGLVQRGMFLIGYTWYAAEAIRSARGIAASPAPDITRGHLEAMTTAAR